MGVLMGGVGGVGMFFIGGGGGSVGLSVKCGRGKGVGINVGIMFLVFKVVEVIFVVR